jgi:PAS domain S-box-containing protein/putative nucleotidyltransferase with HDIG domain
MSGQTDLGISRGQWLNGSVQMLGAGGRLLLDNASEGIAIIQDEVMKLVNPILLKRTGYSEHELTSRPFLDFVHPDDRQMVAERHFRRLKGEEVSSGYRFRTISKHGDTRWVDVKTLLIDWDGRPAVLAFLTDITESKRTREELAGLSGVFRIATEGISIVDLDGTIRDTNEAALKFYGQEDKRNVVGKNILDFITLEQNQKERALASMQGALESGYVPETEYEIAIPDGRRLAVAVSGTLIRDDSGNPKAFVALFRDITERKRAEDTLRTSERRYRLLAMNVSDAIWVTDMNMRPTYLSPSYTRLTGYSQEEALARSAAETLTPASLKVATESFARALAAEREGEKDLVSNLPPLELEMLCKDGTTIWVASTVSFIRDADGRPVEVMGILRDITARKRADELFAALATSSPVGIYIVSDRKFQFVNPQAEKYFGYSQDEILGMDPLQLVIPEDKNRVRGNAVRMLKGESSTAYEYRIVARSGEIRWVTETVSSIQYQGKRATLGNFMDTTDQQEVKERLEESLDKLQRTIEGTVQAIALTVESRDPFTAGHQRRVAQLAGAMAQEMGFSSEGVRVVRIAGLVHDIGKVCIPSEILSKPGQLSKIEFSLIETHCQVGHDILKTVQFPWPIADMVIQHHERIDGSGYPSGLHEDEILMEARILAVADVVEAMTSHRPYRPAPGIDEALEEISRNSGRLYDADAVYACLKLFREKGFAFDDGGLGSGSSTV